MKTIDVTMTAWPNHPVRLAYCARTMAALREKLTATDYELRYYCSAESERDPDHDWYGDDLTSLCRIYDVALSWREGSACLGKNMNAALRLCSADLVFLVQDDYLLKFPLDLAPGARHMEDNPEVDTIRYRWPLQASKPKPRIVWQEQPDGWPLAIAGNIYGDDPHLRRQTTTDKFGWYMEGRPHALSEGDYMKRFRGKAIVKAADRIYFGNIGRVPAVVADTRPQHQNRSEEQNEND